MPVQAHAAVALSAGTSVSVTCQYFPAPTSVSSQQARQCLYTAGLPPLQVKHALLVLLQHNHVVSYFYPEDASAKQPAYYIYEADIGACLQVLRSAGQLHLISRDSNPSVNAVHNMHAS